MRGRSSRRLLTSALAVPLTVAGLLVGLPTGDAGAAGDFVLNGQIHRRWVATQGASDKTVTRDQALTIARRFEVVVAAARTFPAHLSAMRNANPRLAVLVYLNGAFTSDTRSYPEAYYAHDANGERIFSRKWKKWMMDVSNPDWAAEVAQECKADLELSGYDGCYVDMLGTAPLTDGYVSKPPINPATGRVWTKDEYVAATTAIGAKVERANSSYIVVGNGLANGKRYFAKDGATAPLLNGLDGANAEGWIRGANQAINQFRREVDWKKDVDMLVHAGSRGKSVLAMTKVWVSATQAQIDRWHKYALASFLLGNDGNSFFSFYADRDRQSIEEASTPHRWDGVDVGTPSGAYRRLPNGAYRRDFSEGVALVNPTASNVTVELSRPLVDLDGVERTSVVLPANTGEVLVEGS